jgi:hypothetical protein
MAVERDSLEDAILDSMICCEAFLLDDSQGGGELKFRLSLRAAQLLGIDREDKQKIYNSAKSAYNIRSKIVHGKTLTPEQVEKLPDAIDLGRRIAKEIVLLNAKGEKPNWDEMLF